MLRTALPVTCSLQQVARSLHDISTTLPPVKLAITVAALLAFGLAESACAEEDMSFAVKYAPGYSNVANSVSVFGIFKDGRMSPEAWDELGPRLSTAFHGSLCEAAISSDLRRSGIALFAAVDDVSREAGITEPLLERFAPAAKGNSIVVITIAGHAPKSKDARHAATRSQMGMGRGGGPGRRSAAPRDPAARRHVTSNDVFEVSASLYSGPQHQSVALVTMSYTGASEDQALAKFIAKLGATFPGATCAGWKAEALPSEDAIRHLPSP